MLRKKKIKLTSLSIGPLFEKGDIVSRESIIEAIDLSVSAIQRLKTDKGVEFIERVSGAISDCYKKGGKLIIAGNGGSLCDAMHFAEELTGYFQRKRAALPAIALSDPGHLTCVANDTSFDLVFARGVEAHGKEGDVFIALTTSGNSENLVKAAEQAREQNLVTVAFLGKDGGKLKGLCDFEWIVGGFTASGPVQEAHMAAIHAIIGVVEQRLFYLCDASCG